MKTPILLLVAALALPAVVPAAKAQETGVQVFEKGRTAWHRGDLVTARRCFEQLLRARPDFELAKIHLAQVAAAEREIAKIPRSLKVARATTLARITMDKIPLEDAAAVFVRELEKAGGGAGKQPVFTAGTLPGAVSGRLVSITASDMNMDHFLEALGTAGGAAFSYTAEGIAVRVADGARRVWDAGDPKQPLMDAAARKTVIDRLILDGASAGEALEFLAHKAAEVSGGKCKPVFVIRHDCAPRGTITLDLRHVSLFDAVRSVCLMADLGAVWFPWGAGIGCRQAAAPAAGPEVREKAAEQADLPDS